MARFTIATAAVAVALLVPIAPALAAPSAVVPGPFDVVGCSQQGLDDCSGSVADDASWGYAATEDDPAVGLQGGLYPALRWTVPNGGSVPFTLSAATYTEYGSQGACTVYDSAGSLLGASATVPVGGHVFVYCLLQSSAPDLRFGEAIPVTLAATATDGDGSVPLAATAWALPQLPMDITVSRPGTLTATQCSADGAEGLLRFALRVTESRVLREREPLSWSAALALWVADPGDLEFDVETTGFAGSDWILGSAPTATFSPDASLWVNPDTRLVLDSVNLFPVVFGTNGQYWRQPGSGFTFSDVLEFEIPVRWDAEADVLASLSLTTLTNMSIVSFGSLDVEVTNPCLAAATSGRSALPPTGSGDASWLAIGAGGALALGSAVLAVVAVRRRFVGAGPR